MVKVEGYINKHSILGVNIGMQILVREISLHENFPLIQGHPKNPGVFLTPLGPIALKCFSFALESDETKCI